MRFVPLGIADAGDDEPGFGVVGNGGLLTGGAEFVVIGDCVGGLFLEGLLEELS